MKIHRATIDEHLAGITCLPAGQTGKRDMLKVA
jgi:hypothetical protein